MTDGTTRTWSASDWSTASREREDPAAGPRPDRPRETEEAPGRQPGPPEPDEPKRDQPGPISPEPDYLPEGPRDPLPGSGQPSPRRSSGHPIATAVSAEPTTPTAAPFRGERRAS